MHLVHHCFKFLLGVTVVPREIKVICYAKFGGVGGGGWTKCIKFYVNMINKTFSRWKVWADLWCQVSKRTPLSETNIQKFLHVEVFLLGLYNISLHDWSLKKLIKVSVFPSGPVLNRLISLCTKHHYHVIILCLHWSGYWSDLSGIQMGGFCPFRRKTHAQLKSYQPEKNLSFFSSKQQRKRGEQFSGYN